LRNEPPRFRVGLNAATTRSRSCLPASPGPRPASAMATSLTDLQGELAALGGELEEVAHRIGADPRPRRTGWIEAARRAVRGLVRRPARAGKPTSPASGSPWIDDHWIA